MTEIVTTHNSLLAQGIAAARAGDRPVARQLLTRAVRRNPDSEAAWLWLSSVLDTPRGRAFCLQRVLALDPDNKTARQGLAALEAAEPAPTLVAQPLQTVPDAAPSAAAWAWLLPSPGELDNWRDSLSGFLSGAGESARELPPLNELVRQQRFWQVVVACLAIVALSLGGMLVYATLNSSSAAEDDMLAIVPTPTLGAVGTLRPTFTSTPTNTPTPTHTPTPTFTPTSTFTPTPTDTPTPTPTPTRRPRRRRTATPMPTLTPRPTLPPRWLDPRLTNLGVRVEPAFVPQGQPYWRLVEARWTDERESAGKHSIYVEVEDIYGRRVVGQPVVVQWAGGNTVLEIEDVPPPDWGVNFPMYNTLGSYAVSVGGAPSDRIVGMGLGTSEVPNFTIHTCFYLTFRWVYW